MSSIFWVAFILWGIYSLWNPSPLTFPVIPTWISRLPVSSSLCCWLKDLGLQTICLFSKFSTKWHQLFQIIQEIIKTKNTGKLTSRFSPLFPSPLTLVWWLLAVWIGFTYIYIYTHKLLGHLSLVGRRIAEWIFFFFLCWLFSSLASRSP